MFLPLADVASVSSVEFTYESSTYSPIIAFYGRLYKGITCTSLVSSKSVEEASKLINKHCRVL